LTHELFSTTDTQADDEPEGQNKIQQKIVITAKPGKPSSLSDTVFSLRHASQVQEKCN